jgi:hypothetical protein
LGDPLKGNLLLFYKPLHLEAQQVSTRIEVRRHHGPFKPARGKMTHILVMVDKFTKWIEVKPISKCDGHTTVKFLKDIILRYGVPHGIMTDNGSNFAQGPFAKYCEEVGIRLAIPSVAHP